MPNKQIFDFDTIADFSVDKRWQQQQYPMASVLALVTQKSNGADDAKFLLIRRQKEPYKGKWSLVGGKWEFGETLERAATRETYEETGLQTDFVGLKAVVNERVAPSNNQETAGHFLLFVCELRYSDGHAAEQQEGPVGWFSQEELHQLQEQRQIISTDYTVINYAANSGATIPFVEAGFRASSHESEMDIFEYNEFV